jgi:hypothetical protein
MSIEKVLSGIEHVHAFTRAVSVGNPREFLQADLPDFQVEALDGIPGKYVPWSGFVYPTPKVRATSDRAMLAPSPCRCPL